MKTFVNIKSGNRYPEHGCVSSFYKLSSGQLEHHIKPSYPNCTHGWKRVRAKEWREEIIPDLHKDWTREQWLEYAKTYGVICAQEFLGCCDDMKPRAAFRMFNPPKNEKLWAESKAWFKATFKRDIYQFMDRFARAYSNAYFLDVFIFEKHLALEFHYPINSDGSMRDFMIEKFGAENTERFSQLARGS